MWDFIVTALLALIFYRIFFGKGLRRDGDWYEQADGSWQLKDHVP